MWEIEGGWTTVTPPASSSSPSSRAPAPTLSEPSPPWSSSPRTTRRDAEPRRWSPIPYPSPEPSVDGSTTSPMTPSAASRTRNSHSPPHPLTTDTFQIFFSKRPGIL